MKKLLNILLIFPLIAAVVPAQAKKPEQEPAHIRAASVARIQNQQAQRVVERFDQLERDQQAQVIAAGIERFERAQLDAVTKTTIYTIGLVVLIYLVASYYVA